MGNLFDDILLHLKNRKMEFVDRFIPPFLCSFGAHIFNLYNTERDSATNKFLHPIYFEHAEVPSIRLPVMFIAPPGYFKSMAMKHLLRPDYGVLAGAGVPTMFRAYMTEAALVGSSNRTKEGKIERLPGIAEKYSDAVMGIEEYSVMSSTMKQEHSYAMDVALLHLLADGEISKALKGHEINYISKMTIFAGTQFGRFDLRGGIGRRIFFITWTPTDLEESMLQDALWKGLNVELDVDNLRYIRSRLRDLIAKISEIKQIQFTEELKQGLRDVVHHEQKLYIRLAIGWHIMHDNFDGDLVLYNEPGLQRLIEMGVQWKHEALSEAGGTGLLVKMLQTAGKDGMTLEEFVVSSRIKKSKCLPASLNEVVSLHKTLYLPPPSVGNGQSRT